MKIKKIGHCCLVISYNGVRIMTDPGAFSTEQTEEKNIDIILISHEHQDHFHLESLKVVLKNNPKVRVLTNSGVGALLRSAGIVFQVLEHGSSGIFSGVPIEGHGEKHALIYPGWKEVINTGYMIGGQFFYPGDAFYNPQKPVEILALPIAGPWMKIAEAIDYAKLLKPKACFSVHDGILNPKFGPVLTNRLCQTLLSPAGIEWRAVILQEEWSF